MMNRLYRTVFNRSLGVWQTVSELVRCRGMGGNGTAIRCAVISGMLSGGLVMGITQVQAQTVIDGGATVTVPGTYPSPWNGGIILTVGDTGTGTLTIENGGQVSDTIGTIGSTATGNGTVTVDGAGSTWTNISTVSVGKTGTGELTIRNGGKVSNSQGLIGENSGSTGTVTVDGAGSTWTNSGTLIVGNYGAGELTIQNGGTVSSATGAIGNGNAATATGNGKVTVDGAGSIWTISSTLYAGGSNTGTLIIQNGGTVSSNSGNIGNGTTGNGTVTVDGIGSIWTNTGALTVGDLGTGTLIIENGGKVSSSGGQMYIGNNSGSAGNVTVDGAGSSLTNANFLYVGNNGTGELSISNGGQVTSSSGGVIGVFGTGKVTVDGTGSSWTSNGILYVGNNGTGELIIRNGGTVSSPVGPIYVGINSGSTGTVTVDGTGSNWTSTGNITVGLAGTGNLTISNDGKVSAGSVAVAASTGTGTINIGAASGEVAVAAGILDTPTLSLGTQGALVFNHTNDAYAFNTQVSGTGTVSHESGTTVLNGTNSYSGTTTVSGGTLRAGMANAFSSASAVIVGSGGTLDANGLAQTVASLDNAGVVNIGASGMAGNVLSVAGDYTGNGGVVNLNTVLGGDSSVTDKLHVGGNANGTTRLIVTNVNGTGGQTSQGIQVVEVGGTSGGTFALGSSVQAGAYEYALQKGGAAASDENWYLVSRFDCRLDNSCVSADIYRPGVSNYISGQRINTEMGQLQLASLHQRVGEHRSLPLEKQSWARTYYSRLDEDGKTRFGYDADIYGLQIGQEIMARQTGDGGHVRAAISFDYARGDADLEDRMRPQADLNRDTGNLKSDNWALGGYLTKAYKNGAYVDVAGQLAWVRNKYTIKNWDKTGDSVKQTGWRVGVSAEGGYPLWKNESNWLLEGQGQLSYQYTKYRSFTDAVSEVDGYGTDSLRGRLGLRMSRPLVEQEKEKGQVYALLNMYYDFLNPDGVKIGNGDGSYTRVSERYGRTWGEIGLGIQGGVSKSTSVFGDIRYQRGFGSQGENGSREGGALNIGVRHSF